MSVIPSIEHFPASDPEAYWKRLDGLRRPRIPLLLDKTSLRALATPLTPQCFKDPALASRNLFDALDYLDNKRDFISSEIITYDAARVIYTGESVSTQCFPLSKTDEIEARIATDLDHAIKQGRFWIVPPVEEAAGADFMEQIRKAYQPPGPGSHPPLDWEEKRRTKIVALQSKTQINCLSGAAIDEITDRIPESITRIEIMTHSKKALSRAYHHDERVQGVTLPVLIDWLREAGALREIGIREGAVPHIAKTIAKIMEKHDFGVDCLREHINAAADATARGAGGKQNFKASFFGSAGQPQSTGVSPLWRQYVR